MIIYSFCDATGYFEMKMTLFEWMYVCLVSLKNGFPPESNFEILELTLGRWTWMNLEMNYHILNQIESNPIIASK